MLTTSEGHSRQKGGHGFNIPLLASCPHLTGLSVTTAIKRIAVGTQCSCSAVRVRKKDAGSKGAEHGPDVLS